MSYQLSDKFYTQPAILGATEQGALIAALFANIGLRVKIYDRPQEGENPEKDIELAIDHLLQLFPQPFSGQEAVTLIEARNVRDHQHELRDHDLIIECYNGDIREKQAWFSRLAPAFAKNAAILSLSMGDCVEEVAQALPAGLRPRFIGAHFFFQPRLHRLIELIPTPRTEQRLLAEITHFLQNILGSIPIVVADNANFVAKRMLTFAICSAFFHASQLRLDATTLERITAYLTGKQQGFCNQLHVMGRDAFMALYQRISASDHERFGHLLEMPEETLFQPHKILRGTINEELFIILETRNWTALRQLNTVEAQFIANYLRDWWQFLMHIAEQERISGEQIDMILQHAFGWMLPQYQLLQDFSPAQVYSSTKHDCDQEKVHYPLSHLWRRRVRKETLSEQEDDFTAQCQPFYQGQYSRTLCYQERLLVWQPLEPVFGFLPPVLSELYTTINDARCNRYALMIYHHGKQFGGMRQWGKIVDDQADFLSEQALLRDTLVALRMLPQPVVLSISGALIDHGCAIMMQADRIICDVDLSWRLKALDYDLPPLGGMWFEWLHRLPTLSTELRLLQIHTVLLCLFGSGGINSVHAARDFGILRSHDRMVMNPSQLPHITKSVADAWMDLPQARPMRYPIHKLDKNEMNYLFKRSHECAQQALYCDCVRLLGSPKQKSILSFRQFLEEEAAMFNRHLVTPVKFLRKRKYAHRVQ